MSKHTGGSWKYMGTLTRVVVVLLSLSLVYERMQDMAKVGGLTEVEAGLNTLALFSFAMLDPTFWVSLIVPILYLSALWAIGGVFSRMNKGEAFGASMVRGLKDAGTNLMWGAVAAIVIMPSLTWFISNGFTKMYGVKFSFDIESLTFGFIGLALYLLAKHGQGLKSDLESFV